MSLHERSVVSDAFDDGITKVLIVEDNPGDADLLREYLAEVPGTDFEVSHVQKLEAGFNAAQAETPDIIFLDLNLPDAAPEETAGSISHFPPQTPIIVLTGEPKQDLELAALARGAEEFLEKDRVNAPLLDRCIAHAVERNRMVEKLRSRKQELQKYETAIKESPVLVSMKDREGRYELVNPAFQEYASKSSEELIGKTAEEAFGEEVGGAADARDKQVLESGIPSRGEETYFFRGEERVLYITRVPYRIDGEVRGVIAVARDVSEERDLQSRLERRVLRDELTELPNRALFRDRLAQVVERSRKRGERFGVALFDIDRFTTVNDSLGQAAGDEVLRAIGKRITDAFESGVTVARIGSDEFTCILEDACDSERLEEIGQLLADQFEEPFEVNQSEIHLTVSIGFAFADEPELLEEETEAEIDALVRTANRAQFEAKKAGESSWQIFKRSSWGEGSHRIQRANRIRKGLREDEFIPFFQPIYRLDNDHLMALEVLARWDRADRGLVSPAEFIPLAEEMGLIGRIGEAVFAAACRQIGEHLEELDHDGTVRLFINLSPLQLERRESIDRLIETAEEAPGRIEVGFEITETEILKHRSNAIRLREAGHDIWVDDFGTGYSSLARLKELPVDGLKLDMEFVHGVTEGTHDAAIAHTVAELGRRMGVPVIAEGVETSGQFEFLKGAHCTAAQGFLFAHPQPIHNLGVVFES